MPSLKVFGYPIKIVERKPPSEDGEDLQGLFDPQTLTIYLDPALEDDAKKSTLFHECIHAVWYLSGQDQYMSDTQEEAFTRALEHGMWPLIPFFAGLK